MKRRKNPFWVLYLIFVFFPLGAVETILTALTTIVMSALVGDKKGGYYPGMVWGHVMCALAFVSVRVKGGELYDHDKSYIFVSTLQSIYDLWLVYVLLLCPFIWFM